VTGTASVGGRGDETAVPASSSPSTEASICSDQPMPFRASLSSVQKYANVSRGTLGASMTRRRVGRLARSASTADSRRLWFSSSRPSCDRGRRSEKRQNEREKTDDNKEENERKEENENNVN
jgi:hypothetical protein